MIAWNKSTAAPPVWKVDNEIEWIRAAQIPSLWHPPSSLSLVIPQNPPLPRHSQSCSTLNLPWFFIWISLQNCHCRHTSKENLIMSFSLPTLLSQNLAHAHSKMVAAPRESMHSWTFLSVHWDNQAIPNISEKLRDKCGFIWVKLYRLTITTGIISTQHGTWCCPLFSGILNLSPFSNTRIISHCLVTSIHRGD